MCVRLIVLCFTVTLMPFKASAFAEMPGALPMIEGRDTVTGYRLMRDGSVVTDAPGGQGEPLLKMPSAKVDRRAKLLGLFDMGEGGIEAVLGWTDPPVDYIWKHEFQVFVGKRKGEGNFAGTLALDGGPEASVRFYRPPDKRDTPKIVIDVVGGAAWGTSYLLLPSGTSTQKLFEATAYDFVDLNGDGVYELVSWSRRPTDQRCQFGMFGLRVNPEIYMRSGSGYRKLWPPGSSMSIQVMAGLIDVDGDGVLEVASLIDNLEERVGAQKLAIYKLGTSSFGLVAEAPVPWPGIAYWLSIDHPAAKREIELWIANRAKCEAGENPEGSGTAVATYVFKAGRLERTAIRTR
jgi:hypothetical protein